MSDPEQPQPEQPLVNESLTAVWRKGDPRSEAEASACIHQNQGFPFQIHVRTVPKKGVVRPHETGFDQEYIVLPVQPFRLTCNSPEVLAMAHAGLQITHPGTKGQIHTFDLVSWDLCRICPFWKAPPTQ